MRKRLLLALSFWFLIATSLGYAFQAHSISLSWDAPASSPDPVATYNVYRGIGSGTPTFIANSATTAYVDTAVTVGVIYTYYVTSVDADGFESLPSNEIITISASAPASSAGLGPGSSSSGAQIH